jgi:hypothetical protein
MATKFNTANALSKAEIERRERESEAETATDMAALIRAFLTNTQPLTGNCYCNDDTFWEGRCLIEELARGYAAQILPVWSLRECADVLHHVANVESLKCRLNESNVPKLRMPTFSEFSGFHVLMNFVEDALRAAVARPPRGTANKRRRRRA